MNKGAKLPAIQTHTRASTETASRMRPRMTKHQHPQDVWLCCPQQPKCGPLPNTHTLRPIPPTPARHSPLSHLPLPSSLCLRLQQNPHTLFSEQLCEGGRVQPQAPGTCRSESTCEKDGDGHSANLYSTATSQPRSPPPKVTNVLASGVDSPSTSLAGTQWLNGPLRLDVHLTYPPTGPWLGTNTSPDVHRLRLEEVLGHGVITARPGGTWPRPSR